MQPDQRDRRSPLGLGPLEAAIMQVMWEADGWLMVRDIRDRMDYAPVAYTTVSKVTGILCDKDLLIRRLEDRAGKPGPAAWWYQATRSMNEYVGELIAQLMDYSPDPEAALAYAMAARQGTPTEQPLSKQDPAVSVTGADLAEEEDNARITRARTQPRP